MNAKWTTAGVLTVLLLVGCGDRQLASNGTTDAVSAASATTTITAERLGAIGAEVEKNPAEVDRILSKHGLDRDSFEKAIRMVSANPAEARKYRDAYQKAKA